MFLETFVIVCAYQKRTTQQSTMTGIIFRTFIHPQQSTATENVQAAFTACVARPGAMAYS
jgi:hypothetical protein